jgi:diaminopimelate epimerase
MTMQPFVKMHGLGNDFVVLDARTSPLSLDARAVRAIADRKTGVGCDQLIAIEHSDRADAFMRIWNADGAEVEACGNGTRCIGALLIAGAGRNEVTIETVAGLLEARSAADGEVSVDMGVARLAAADIPLAKDIDTLHVPIVAGGQTLDGVAVNMGNPHIVFFVPDAEAVNPAALGPAIEHDPMFPERVNVTFASVGADGTIRMRVWERGVGVTMACGTAACATMVAAVRRGLSPRNARIRLDGGTLGLEWREDGHVMMTGPVALSFTGLLPANLLGPPAEG